MRLDEDFRKLREEDELVDISHWTEGYDEFQKIVISNWPYVDIIMKKVNDLYTTHKGEKGWDEAYRRWNEGDGSELSEKIDIKVTEMDDAIEAAKKALAKTKTAYAAVYGYKRTGEPAQYFSKPLIKYSNDELKQYADSMRKSSKSRNDVTIYTLYQDKLDQY